MDNTATIKLISKLALGFFGIYTGMNGSPIFGFFFLALAMFY
jgi:hypothetical protein